MNKIIIPTILTAAILVAATFAFMPVEKVSTVHTTIQNTVGLQKTLVKDGVSLNPADGATATTVGIAAATGKTFTGTLNLIATNLGTDDNANTLTVRCVVSGTNNDREFTVSPVTITFTCDSMELRITDNAGTTDAAAAVINAEFQFTEISTITTQTT